MNVFIQALLSNYTNRTSNLDPQLLEVPQFFQCTDGDVNVQLPVGIPRYRRGRSNLKQEPSQAMLLTVSISELPDNSFARDDSGRGECLETISVVRNNENIYEALKTLISIFTTFQNITNSALKTGIRAKFIK